MNNINVGWGPVTWKGLISGVVWGLAAISTFCATLAGSVPADKGVLLTAIAAGAGALDAAIVAASRVLFAKIKANVMPWEEDPIDPVPSVPTDVPASDVPTDPTTN